ncbi:aminoacetone oxidase family FAD-binding enzyme [Cerasicoccus arenae]|uniref:Carbon dioxide concentrating mechanism protein CcmK n=1 Tax=Cerasicoccus arenae TaxID=424488 RepID=A0A8J3DFB7_9BACT|nr:aminoacetone oxidase family FAD-binding enzyme [Cerasicoccus arenae]MBK1857187.1 aminoacetone oxidase family FAD-binding enzyme [Cerasicoccus arenae]GHB99869.1 carbon dioxide concentrating mechanism protein CcmK [Cerasicoccus arenae]
MPSSSSPPPHIVVVGGGPAGVFAALTAAASPNGSTVTLLETEPMILRAWRSPGTLPGGLTREIWDPAEFATLLGAGSKEMIGPLTRYGPGDFEAWLEEHDADLQVDKNGRAHIRGTLPLDVALFFERKLAEADVNVRTSSTLRAVDIKSTGGFWLTLADERTLQVDQLILAAGGLIANPTRRIVQDLGHTITDCFPALTGFQSTDSRLRGVSGALDGQYEIRVGDTDHMATGRIAIEAWGFSGPAVWELSTRQAHYLDKLHNRFPLRISWLPGGARMAAKLIEEQLRRFPSGRVGAFEDSRIPHRLWKNLLTSAKLSGEETWDSLTPPLRSSLVRELASGEYEIVKKKNVRGVSSVLGGVTNDEVDFRTLASRRVPGLYFAGDILDACGIGPAENLQIAWTTGWIAGSQATDIGH